MIAGDFENLLKQTMGLDPASVGSPAVESAIRQRMKQVGVVGTSEYWELLQSSVDELQELIETVVVRETFFYRDPDAFTALTHLVCSEWLPRHADSTLRLLSGPCCTGEEPYSMAMAMLDAGFPEERLQIDAVDISRHALDKAGRGVYGAHSFRGEQTDFRLRYFDRTAGGYRLQEKVRRLVTFRRANLLSPDFESADALYDVIFCRNVLIYFDRSAQEQVFSRLKQILTPGGFLFVGPAEAFLASCNGFKAVDRSMAFAFRREDSARQSRLSSTDALRAREIARPAAKPLLFPPSAPKRIAPVLRPVTDVAAEPPIDLDAARRLADSGQLRESSALCEAYLRRNSSSAEAHYLLAVVRDAMGDVMGALESYRRALYLQPEHEEALFHMAILTERQGDPAGAQRLRERVQRISKGAR